MTIPRQGARPTSRARDALFAKNPHCHWCNVLTLHPSVSPPFDPNMATLDHVKPRRECTSFEQYRAETNHVLSCMECNQQRDAVDIALLDHQKKKQEFLDRLKASARRVMVRTKYLG